ncbi:MAG TPA: Crp/Fnr family transcriptional regulator [Chitinophagaceae bacterium]|nr:Crp/Fnr family transcriptional regulator [Chitinophagaceae bacterium]
MIDQLEMMNKQSFVEFIKMHSPATNDVIEEIVTKFQTHKVEKDSFFLKQGELSDVYLFLESGIMRSYTFDMDGNEITTNFFKPNSVVFEVASFFNRSKSLESIQALTDCYGYSIRYLELNELFHSIPEFREFGRSLLVKGYVALKQRTLSVIHETAEERYIQLLESNEAIFQHASLKSIASYLGITDTSLSRIRSNFYKK